MTKHNNTSYENHSDSSSSSSGNASSRTGNSRSGSSGYVKLATMTTSAEQEGKQMHAFRQGHYGRQRASQSFSQMAERDAPKNDLFAGSAASPDATALPQPPKAWLASMGKKDTGKKNDMDKILKAFDSATGKLMENCANAPIKPTTTTTPPPANVQKFFASFTLVSTTA